MDSDKDLGLIGRVQNLLKPVEEISKLGFFVVLVEINEKLL